MEASGVVSTPPLEPPLPASALNLPAAASLDSAAQVGPSSSAASTPNIGQAQENNADLGQRNDTQRAFTITGTGASGLTEPISVTPQTQQEAVSPGLSEEPEPARITSDIPTTPLPVFSSPVQPQMGATPAMARPAASSAASTGATDREKRDIERRNALRVALKKRWASGSMDHVHKKRLETLKRRKQQAELENSALHKGKGSGAVQKVRLGAGPGRKQKSSPSSEQLARLFSDNHVSKSSTPDRSRLSESVDTYGASESTTPGSTSDVDMADSNAAPEFSDFPADFVMKDDELDGDWEGSNKSSSRSPPRSPTGASEVEELARSGAPSVPLQPPPSIEEAAPGRSYRVYIDENGRRHRSRGVLIPEGYQLSDAVPGFPWVCPIRSCRKVFNSIRSLGAHFVNLHRGTMLHDNLDGTLSFRGHYDPGRTGHDKKPSLVVSRGPPPPDEPPPIEPSVVLKEQTTTPRADQTQPSSSQMVSDTTADIPTRESPALEENGPWRALWDYMQPFLLRHKGPKVPDKGHVAYLITLPRVRDIEWNHEWLSAHPFLDSQPRDVSAMIIQLTGEPAPSPCKKCSEGRGPFKGCIMISSKAHPLSLRSIFACANCFYHYGQTYCSHKEWGARRSKELMSKRVARVLATKGMDREGSRPLDKSSAGSAPEPDSSPDWEPQAASATETQPNQDDQDASKYWNGVIPDKSIPSDPDGRSIPLAEPGRPYDMWPDEFGVLTNTNGVLLPKGYQLSTTVPSRPWICPIRTCRQLFIKRNELGYHFQRSHFGTLLNDNRDGTLTLLGIYQSRQISTSGTPQNKSFPLIVSQDPSTIKEKTENPRLPDGVEATPEMKLALKAEAERNKDPNMGDPEALWDYIVPYLARDEPPGGGYVRELLSLPRKRELVFNPLRAGGSRFEEKAHRDISAMIIQLTGEFPPETCTRCQNNKGIFGECVVISTRAFPDARSRYISCANCLYHGNQTYCNLKEWVVERPQPPFPRHRWVGGRALTEGSRAKGKEDSNFRQYAPEKVATSAESGSKSTVQTYNAPSRPGSTQSEGSITPGAAGTRGQTAESWRPEIRPPPVPAAQRPAPPPSTYQSPNPPAQPPQDSATARVTRSAQKNSVNQAIRPQTDASSLISPGAMQPVEILEMETWEVAPGRIRESAATNPENIAFSKAYLSTNQVVPVCEDVSFRVDTIHSGATLQIKSEDNETRICSVATGKVRVRMDREPEFTIGPHGMFKVKPGATCTVQNWMYMDAIIHVTVLSGFM